MVTNHILVVSRGGRLARAVRTAAGPGCRVVGWEHTADLESPLVGQGPFDVLVAGPAFDSAAGLERLARLRLSHPELAVVLVLPPEPRAALRDLVRAGAVDLVLDPSDPRAMSLALDRALRQNRAHGRADGPDGPLEAAAQSRRTALAEVFTVASSSGGCGKTFYSTNLTHYLADTTGQRVCLVDLDLQFGEVVTALRLKARHTISDVVALDNEDGALDLSDTIDQYLVAHPNGYWVLPAPRDPAEADDIGAVDVIRIMAALRRRFDFVIVDTPAALNEPVLAALDQSTRVLCMVTFDLPSVRNTVVMLRTLEKLKIPPDRVSVILNKVERDVGMDIEEVNKVFDHLVHSMLPYDKEVSRSINEGRPVIEMAPRSEVSRRMVAGMSAYHRAAAPAPVAPGAPTPARPRRHLFRRLALGA